MALTKQVRKERLLLAYQILDGIPEKVIQLDAWRAKEGKSLACGTIACGGGWLSMHPTFNEMGLTMHTSGLPTKAVHFSRERHVNLYAGDALDQIFGQGMSRKLFNSFGGGLWDKELTRNVHTGEKIKMTHKQLLLARISKAYHQL